MSPNRIFLYCPHRTAVCSKEKKSYPHPALVRSHRPGPRRNNRCSSNARLKKGNMGWPSSVLRFLVGSNPVSLMRLKTSLQARQFSVCSRLNKTFNFPTSPNDMPRSGGIASMMRLPIQSTAEGLDACFVGIPLDSGASNRSGTRYVF